MKLKDLVIIDIKNFKTRNNVLVVGSNVIDTVRAYTRRVLNNGRMEKNVAKIFIE